MQSVIERASQGKNKNLIRSRIMDRVYGRDRSGTNTLSGWETGLLIGGSVFEGRT